MQPPKKKKTIKFNMLWMYAIIILLLAGIFYLDNNSITQKYSYEKFKELIVPGDSVPNPDRKSVV